MGICGTIARFNFGPNKVKHKVIVFQYPFEKQNKTKDRQKYFFTSSGNL